MKRITTIWLLTMLVSQSCLKIENTNSSDEAGSLFGLIEMEEVQDSSRFVSLTGQVLHKPDLDRWTRAKREEELEAAYNDYLNYPDSMEMICWYGRRLSYLYQYEEAIQVFTEGIKKHPDAYQLYRHRGHRYLTIRQVDRAISDLEQAAFFIRKEPIKVEEDGIPNDRNIPRSSVQFNVWYHLGLAYYIKGNFDKAVSAYKKCMALADNHDMQVSVTNWLYLTYHKIGNVDAAEKILEPIKERMNVVENYQYHNLLLMYKGLVRPESLFEIGTTDGSIAQSTIGYGVGNWYYYHGQQEKAISVFNKVLESPYWQAFGYLASEMEVATLNANAIAVN